MTSLHHPHNVFRCEGGLFGWRLGRSEKVGYRSYTEAAKDYVTALMEREPNVREFLHGRTWRECFRMLGFQLLERE